MAASEFSFVVMLRSRRLELYPAGHTIPAGSHPVAIVDGATGTWTGYVPYPFTPEHIDDLARTVVDPDSPEGSADLCETFRSRPIESEEG